MRAILALFTCSSALEIALATGHGSTPSLVRLAGGAPRSALLLAGVDLLFEDAGLEPGALDRVIVSRGPGSFTGIRAGLATAFGLATSTGVEVTAYDGPSTQAARASAPGTVWTAQPGRRGEIYVRPMYVGPDHIPVPAGPLTVMKVEDAAAYGPWLAPPELDLGRALRREACCSSAEALLRLNELGVPGQPVEPLYVEDHPGIGRTRG